MRYQGPDAAKLHHWTEGHLPHYPNPDSVGMRTCVRWICGGQQMGAPMPPRKPATNPRNPITKDLKIISSRPTVKLTQVGRHNPTGKDAVLFEHHNYSGPQHRLPIGAYNMLPGWTNDAISSVKVGRKRILHLHEHRNL